MPKRKGISKKDRFEIFKRDEFTCLYCGGTPPKSILQIDHIHPVKEGGDNHMDNLVTACSDCNLGKGARLLEATPESLKAKYEKIKEQEEQMTAYRQLIIQRKEREDETAWDIVRELGIYQDIEDDKISVDGNNFKSIKMFLRRMPYSKVMSAAEIASSQYENIFRYFCGICWNMIKELENE